jgi:hypothetical protein
MPPWLFDYFIVHNINFVPMQGILGHCFKSLHCFIVDLPLFDTLPALPTNAYQFELNQ